MKRFLLVLLATLFLIGSCGVISTASDMVYVSPSGNCYHKEIHGNMNADTSSEISLEEAEEKGYLPCEVCYNTNIVEETTTEENTEEITEEETTEEETTEEIYDYIEEDEVEEYEAEEDIVEEVEETEVVIETVEIICIIPNTGD